MTMDPPRGRTRERREKVSEIWCFLCAFAFSELSDIVCNNELQLHKVFSKYDQPLPFLIYNHNIFPARLLSPGKKRKTVIVLAATNTPWDLDEALRRR